MFVYAWLAIRLFPNNKYLRLICDVGMSILVVGFMGCFIATTITVLQQLSVVKSRTISEWIMNWFIAVLRILVFDTWPISFITL